MKPMDGDAITLNWIPEIRWIVYAHMTPVTYIFREDAPELGVICMHWNPRIMKIEKRAAYPWKTARDIGDLYLGGVNTLAKQENIFQRKLKNIDRNNTQNQ